MTSRSLTASALQLLTDWAAPDAAQESLRRTYLDFLDATTDPCLRSSVTGHLTGSVVVFDATLSYVLLTLHPRVGRWLQLGGHCEEADETIRDAAAREGLEESGITGLRLTEAPVKLDRHPITCSLGVPTFHLDVQFAAVAPATSDGVPPQPMMSHESTDLAWWPVGALPSDVGSEIVELVDRGIVGCQEQ